MGKESSLVTSEAAFLKAVIFFLIGILPSVKTIPEGKVGLRICGVYSNYSWGNFDSEMPHRSENNPFSQGRISEENGILYLMFAHATNPRPCTLGKEQTEKKQGSFQKKFTNYRPKLTKTWLSGGTFAPGLRAAYRTVDRMAVSLRFFFSSFRAKTSRLCGQNDWSISLDSQGIRENWDCFAQVPCIDIHRRYKQITAWFCCWKSSTAVCQSWENQVQTT
jgi:hypothetical protein